MAPNVERPVVASGTSPTQPTRLMLISGSLRSESVNTAVLRTVEDLAPEGVEARLWLGLAALPHFNPDDDHAPLPAAVAELRATIHNATGILFCVPEYAGALPGPLLNLLDWTISDELPGSIYGKSAAWINASPRGAATAHASLRMVLRYAGAWIVEAACVDVPVTRQMTDGSAVTDRAARGAIERAVNSLVRGGLTP